MKLITLITAGIVAGSTLITNGSENVVQRRIPTLQLGSCAITLLDSDGITPLKGAILTLNQVEDGAPVLEKTANQAGLCEITVSEGRYVLHVNERPITLINASEAGELAWARIVVSDTPMLVGGQDGAMEAEGGRRLFTFFGLQGGKAVAAAFAAAGAVGGGAYAVYDNNRSSDSSDEEDDEESPIVTPPTRPRPVSP